MRFLSMFWDRDKDYLVDTRRFNELLGLESGRAVIVYEQDFQANAGDDVFPGMPRAFTDSLGTRFNDNGGCWNEASMTRLLTAAGQVAARLMNNDLPHLQYVVLNIEASLPLWQYAQPATREAAIESMVRELRYTRHASLAKAPNSFKPTPYDDLITAAARAKYELVGSIGMSAVLESLSSAMEMAENGVMIGMYDLPLPNTAMPFDDEYGISVPSVYFTKPLDDPDAFKAWLDSAAARLKGLIPKRGAGRVIPMIWPRYHVHAGEDYSGEPVPVKAVKDLLAVFKSLGISTVMVWEAADSIDKYSTPYLKAVGRAFAENR